MGKAGSVPAGGLASEIVFGFHAKSGGVAVPAATTRGYLGLADPAGQTSSLTLAIQDRLPVGNLNSPLAFQIEVRNTGADIARGCHFCPNSAPFNAPYLRVAFFRIDPSTGKSIGPLNEPSNISPGKSQTFRVEFRAQASRRADLEFGLNTEINAFCLNRNGPPLDLRQKFDFTAAGTNQFTNVASRLMPNRTVLSVPKTGTASFDVVATNSGRSLPLVAVGRYLHLDSNFDPDAAYTVTTCRLTAKGKCIAPAASTADWTPKSGESAKFRVFVKAPKVDPGFNPAKFRVYLDFRAVDNDRPNVFGSSDIAVRRNEWWTC